MPRCLINPFQFWSDPITLREGIRSPIVHFRISWTQIPSSHPLVFSVAGVMLETQDHIELNFDSIERGYKSCRGAVKKFFKGHLWYVNNIPGEQRRALDAILFNLMRTIDLLDLESASGLPLDVWHEIRDDMSDAFRDRCSCVELAALVDAARRFNVPKQFLFDPLRGADLWIRTHEFNTFDELETFCSDIGGSSLASVVPVLGTVKEGWENAAVLAGKSIMLTQIMAGCLEDMKQNKLFFAKEDLKACDVDLAKLKLRQETKQFRHLIRVYAARVEAIMIEGAKLIEYMDFDGKRSIKALLGYYWKMLTKMKVEPSSALNEHGVFTRGEQLGLTTRHLMGMEPKIPIFPDESHHHH